MIHYRHLVPPPGELVPTRPYQNCCHLAQEPTGLTEAENHIVPVFFTHSSNKLIHILSFFTAQ